MTSGGLERIAKLGWIKNRVITWWDLDYLKDPRELLDFSEFEKRLEHIGQYPLSPHHREPHDLRVYTGDKVPVTTLEINVEGMPVTLFITARPYTPKETLGQDEGKEKLISDLKKDVRRRGCWGRSQFSETTADMFLPHIRGYVKERTGNRFLYHPVRHGICTGHETVYEYEERIRQMYASVQDELRRAGKEYLLFRNWYTYVPQFDDNTPVQDKVNQASSELLSKRVVRTRKRKGKSYSSDVSMLGMTKIAWEGLEWVAYDELKPDGKDLVAYYPVRLQGMTETIPVAISTRTHPNGNTGLFVLGVFYSYYNGSDKMTPPSLSAIPFTNPDSAEEAAEQVSTGLNSRFRSVILNRRKGRGYYSIV